MKQIRSLVLSALFVLLVSGVGNAAKTVFQNGDKTLGIQGTKVTAEYLNAVNNQRHDGQANDGSGILDYYLDTGAVNAVVIAPSPALTAHVPGMPLWFKAVATNTGGGTITVNALTAVPLVRPGGAALVVGDITAGQICQAAWDGTKYQLLGTGGGSGNLTGRQILFSGTTYTPTAGTNSIIVELVGGGGGGGGVTGSVSNAAAGSGGNAGGYVKHYFTGISGTYAYSIGAAGLGGVNTGGTGGTGGNTVFTGPDAVVRTAFGGVGGSGMLTGLSLLLSTPGGLATTTAGDITFPGAQGAAGIRLSGTVALAGSGGASLFGSGGANKATPNIGSSATGRGAGGAGALSLAATAYPGGDGSPGIIVIWEYK